MKVSDGIKCLAVLSLAGYALTNAHAQTAVANIWYDTYIGEGCGEKGCVCTSICVLPYQQACAMCGVSCSDGSEQWWDNCS
jgi:hypothetical protein